MRNAFWFVIACFLFSCGNYPEQTNVLKVHGSVRAVKAFENGSYFFATSNGVVGKTTNNGVSWKLDTLLANGKPLHFRSIEVKNNFIIVGGIGSPAYLMRANLNITNWDTVYKENHPKAFYNCIKFWDAQNGIAVGDATDSCMSIIITNDSGKSWHKKPCDSTIAVIEGEANFAASNTNIATFQQHCWIATGGKQANIFYTSDYGQTWRKTTTPFTQGSTMTGIYAIDFYNENLGFAIGGDWENKANKNANKAITNDGGKTWQIVGNENYPGYRSCVKYISHDSLIAVGSPGVSLSKDGGTTWQHLSDSGFYTVEINQTTQKLILGGRNKVVITDLAGLK